MILLSVICVWTQQPSRAVPDWSPSILMLAIVTGFLASGLRVLAVPRHVHQLAARTIMLPQRGGTIGGYLGLAQGSVVMVLGLVALLARRRGVDAPVGPAGLAVGVL